MQAKPDLNSSGLWRFTQGERVRLRSDHDQVGRVAIDWKPVGRAQQPDVLVEWSKGVIRSVHPLEIERVER